MWTIKSNTIEFINKSKLIHGDKYDYSLVDYKDAHTKVKIICPTHGIFEQRPYTHTNKSGCNKCAIEFKARSLSLTTKQFIEKSNKTHNNKYDYSLSEYRNNSTKIKIICPIHGVFNQKPITHLTRIGCPSCGGTKKLTTKEFIEKSKKIHGDKYDYSLVTYKNISTKVKIICPMHGVFEKRPISHIYNNKRGCPKCISKSKGENEIRLFLENNSIDYISEKTFDDCKNILKLPFDFYLEQHNTRIEFDGVQHFIHRPRFGGVDALIQQQMRDKIKTDYCLNNGIELIRIKYTDNIMEKLKSELLFLI